MFGDGLGFSVATTPAVLAGSTFSLPSGSVGVIRSLVLGVNSLLATSDIQWRLRFDGAPVEGWSPLTIFPGLLGQALYAWGPDETQIPVPEGATIDVEVVVLDAGTYQLGAQYHGWSYGREIHEAFRRAWRYS